MYKPLAPGSMADALRRHSQTLAEIKNDRPYTGSTFPARHNEDRFHVNGAEPDGLSIAQIMKNIPEEWNEQRKSFGFPER